MVAATAAFAFAGGLLLGSILGTLPGGAALLQLGAASAAEVPGAPDRPDDADQQATRVPIGIPPRATPAAADAAPTPIPLLLEIAPPTATPLPTLPPTAAPTEVPTLEPTPTEPPAALFVPATESRVALAGLRHEWQTWNNCGPATLATLLSYWGSPLSQADIGNVLRRSADDKNVSPEELVDYARSQGKVARLRVNGSAALMRTLLANGYPVLIETWLEETPNDGMGHYRLLTGYDDALGGWIVYDSYVSHNLIAGGAKDGSGAGAYAGILMPYAEADGLWKVFNRTYLLVYPPEDEGKVNAILAAHGPSEDGALLWQASETTARAEIAANGADPFAWFNLGSTLWAQGRAEEAAAAFDQAVAIGLPWRMFWYQFGPFAAWHAVGRDADALALANQTLAIVDSLEEVHYWRGIALRALGDEASARAAFERALALAPNFVDAQNALLQ